MEKADLIWVATWAFDKGYDYEKTHYSDYMYGKEDLIDDVWEYVNEIEEIGTIAFKEKYKEYKMFNL